MNSEISVIDALNSNGFVITGHIGSSMYPFIELDDKLLVLKKDKEIEKYDIVMYQNKDRYVVHRVIGETDNKYIIRGDNCLTNEYIEKDRIIGYLDTIYRDDKEIKITKELNIKYYRKSCLSLPYRKAKYFIRRVIKKIIGK